jgi:hypothetical protein
VEKGNSLEAVTSGVQYMKRCAPSTRLSEKDCQCRHRCKRKIAQTNEHHMSTILLTQSPLSDWPHQTLTARMSMVAIEFDSGDFIYGAAPKSRPKQIERAMM